MSTQKPFKLAEVKMSEITPSKTNENIRSEKSFEGPAWNDFVESIRSKGIIQPILIRPAKKGYELVCGERRFRAMQVIAKESKEKDSIPCKIQELTDEEAVSLQLIENLDREDIHPLKEAEAYARILSDNKTAKDIATQFAKSEVYVTRRLALLTLIPDAKKAFLKDEINLSHALLISRLVADDQKSIIERAKWDGIGTVQQLEKDINHNYALVLSKTSFKKDDLTLNPKAGACTSCAKRSGANPLLFGDIKNADTCFDSVCFEIKRKAHLIATVKSVIENEMDIVLTRGYSDLLPEIEALLKEHDIKPLHEYTHFRSRANDKKEKPVKALWISGSDAGTKHNIFPIKTAKTEKSKPAGKGAAAEDVLIIKERLKRSNELDEEKSYVKIIEGLGKSAQFKTKKIDKIFPIDTIIMRFLVCSIGYVARDFGLDVNTSSGVSEKIKKIASLGDKEFHALCRKIMLKQFAGQAPNVKSVAGQILWRSAIDLDAVDVTQIESEQAEVKTRREERAKKRIADLKSGKPAKPKKEKVEEEEPDTE